MNLDLFLTMQNEDFRKTFGGRLKNLRKQKRWSQKELAAKVEIRFQQLNKYESGLNLPPAEMLIKLADALGTTVDFLLTGNPAEEMPLGNTRLYKRFKAVEDFDGADQETVISLIDAMIAKLLFPKFQPNQQPHFNFSSVESPPLSYNGNSINEDFS